MRTILVICLVVSSIQMVLSQSMFLYDNSYYSSQQSYSARLEGMGNLSIAVPEPESEAYINPANAALTSGILLRFHPNYLHFNNASEYSYSSSSSPSSSTSQKDEYRTTSASFPLDALISFDILHIGASYSREAFSSRDYSENGSTPSNPSKYETQITNYGSTAKLLADYDLGILSIGAMGTFIGTNLENKYNSKNNYSYDTNSSSITRTIENKTPDDFSSKEIRLGALLNLGDVTQISTLFGLSSAKDEQKASETRYDGILQPNNNHSIYSAEIPSNLIGAELRQRLSKTFLLGIRVQRTGLTEEDFGKNNYLDYGILSPIYEKRKNAETDATEFGGGVGISFQPTEGTLASIEFELTTFTHNDKSIEAVENGPSYSLHRGAISGETKYSGVREALRAGGEVAISSFLTLRAGIEAVWQSYDYEYNYISDYSTPPATTTASKSLGNTSAFCTGRLGATFTLSFLRIDYALALQTSPWYSSHSIYSNISYSSSQDDMHFRHSLTATIQL